MSDLRSHPVFLLTEQFAIEYASFRPMVATAWGFHQFDWTWGDLSERSYSEELKLVKRYIGAFQDLQIKHPLPSDGSDDSYLQLAYETLDEVLHHTFQRLSSDAKYYELMADSNTLKNMIEIFERMKRETQEDWAKIASRLKLFDLAFRQYMQVLREGLRKGKVVPKRQAKTVLLQVETLLEQNRFGERLSLYNKRNCFITHRDLIQLTDKRKLLTEFAQFLRYEYIPQTKQNDSIGRSSYQSIIQNSLGKSRVDLKDIYRSGFADIASLIKETRTYCRSIDPLGCKSYVATFKRFKADSNLQTRNFSEFVCYVKQLYRSAIPQLRRYFTIPETIVQNYTIGEEPLLGSGAVTYNAAWDWSSPALLVYSFESREVRVELVRQTSIAYHEGFPGHLLQSGLQVNNPRLSVLGKVEVMTCSFAEGWGLYSERFMDEIGAYKRPELRLGMLMNHLLRACRVVIDIGLHCGFRIPRSFWWKGGKRISFNLGKEMLKRLVGMPEKSAEDEMIRYSANPGQAVCYQLGYRTIVDLRKKSRLRWERALGSGSFDLKRFHDTLLSFGTVGLDQLERLFTKFDKEQVSSATRSINVFPTPLVTSGFRNHKRLVKNTERSGNKRLKVQR